MSKKLNSYKELIVWQKGIELCELIYLITQKFPKSEQYGLTSQIRRCCVAIPSNIAEGSLRGHKKEYVQFLHVAFGSGAELETQLLIAQKVGYLDESDFNKTKNLVSEIMKMLNVLISQLNERA